MTRTYAVPRASFFAPMLLLGACGGGGEGPTYGGGGGSGTPPAPSAYVFATSTTMTGNLGGLSGADAVCSQAAAAAALPGTFVAWMSTSAVNATSRVTDVSGGWMLPGTTTAAVSTKAELENLQTAAAVDRDQNGTVFSSVPQTVWAGTGSGGTAAIGSCSDWTGTSGAGGIYEIGNGTGIGLNSASCASTARLLCLGQ